MSVRLFSRFFSRKLFAATLVCLILVLVGRAQTFKYKNTEMSEIKTAADFDSHGLPDTLTTWCSDWDFVTSNPSTWGNTFKLKANNAIVKFGINNYHPTTVNPGTINYVYHMTFEVYGFNDPSDTTTGYVHSSDTLTISYAYGISNPYQDIHLKKYSGYYKTIVIVTGIYSDLGGVISPAPLGTGYLQNFYVESSITTQRFDKTEYGVGMTPLVTNPISSGTGDYLNLFWNYSPGDTTPVQLTPCSFELEWTYVDDYSRDLSTGAISTLSPGSVNYDFSNNCTRVKLESNFYRIPLVYSSGYLVFRVRTVRPDSNLFQYPVYGDWSLASSGIISSLSSNEYYHIATPYTGDSLNWQHTITFSENGKSKQVAGFFDGLHKNRQSITKLNTDVANTIVTQSIYDFEGRPALKTIPAPVKSSFRYIADVDLDSVTGDPYRADYFDTGYATCPSRPVISPLADNALASVYYSDQNPDTAGFQKFVPDAEGYPLIQSIYSPGYNDRLEELGGAGATLQIGNDHTLSNCYVGSSQASLNSLFGINAGWQNYYNTVVSKDPNKQYSMSMKDYKGRQIMTAMIGPGPNPADHAIVSVDAPPFFTLREDLLYMRPQTIIGNTKIADYDFFNEANGMDSLQYIYRYQPFPICPGQDLSVKAHFRYEVIDQCGVVVASQDSILGVNGITTGPTSFTGSVNTFYATVAPYHVHKELTIDPYDMSAALDSFFNAPPSCFSSEPFFIRTAVEERAFPCPAPRTPCEEKKWQMIQDMFPNAKYGKYTMTGTMVNNTPNSIFTRYSTPGDPYRYQDTCTVPSLFDTITAGGISYTNLRTMRTDSFIAVYERAIAEENYSIAEALLPLHPEYCQLKECFDDTFKTMVLAIPDAKVAERLNRLHLDSIVANDPLVPLMVTAGYTAAADSLKTFCGGTRRLDSITLITAYCGCSDSVMFKQCVSEMFNPEITGRVLQNDNIKKYYFENLPELYFANRNRFINAISMGRGDSCSHCALRRMTIIPDPIFDMSTSPSGAIEMDSLSTYSSFSGSGSLGWLAAAAGVVADSMDSTLTALYDSALTAYTFVDTTLCFGAVDSILARLANCIQGNPATYAAIRSTLDSLCGARVIRNGNYLPEQIYFALTRNGISMGDLCNPYLICYSNIPAPDPPSQNCKQDTFYRSLSSFLSDTAVTNSFGATYSLHSYALDVAGNIFEASMSSVIGTTSAEITARYDTGDKLLSLLVYNPSTASDTIRLFLRTPIFGNVFDSTADSFVVKAKCINVLPQSFTVGLVNEYTFFAEVTRYATSVFVTSTMLGWVDTLPTMYPDTNPLAGCIPCTQMRSLFDEFSDTLATYAVKGVDHPYYDQMLLSFMNYRLQQSFTSDQYERFIESCALADSMIIPKYVSYATYTFADSAGMSHFIDTLNLVDTNYSFDNCYREDNGTNIRVFVNLNSVPLGILWKYRQRLDGYMGAYISRVVNAPLATLQTANTIGFLYTDPTFPFSPCDSTIFGTSDSVSCTASTKKVWVSDHFETVDFYEITTANLTPPYRTQESIHKLESYLYDEGTPAAMFIPNYLTTIDKNYYKPEKKDYLRYVYSMQDKAPYEVLDSVREQYLVANIPSYASYNVSYTKAFDPELFNNLYIAGPTMTNRFMDTVKEIFNMVETLNPVSVGDVFFDTNRVDIPVTGSRSLIAFRCGDETYWYRYFGQNDTLYSVFVDFPRYIPLYLRRQYQIVPPGIVPDLGDSITRFFTMYMRRPGDTATIQAKCMATFNIGNNLVLNDVLFGQPISSAGPGTPTELFDNCEKDILDGAIEEGIIFYNRYVDSMKRGITADFEKYMMDSVHEELILSYLNNEFAYTLYGYDRAGNLTSTVPPMGVQKLPLSSSTTVDDDRRNYAPESLTVNSPATNKKNTYKYNAINQLTSQKTINGGSVTFQYDKANRLVLSQNAKQLLSASYTYNLYDNQSRIIETGEANILPAYMLSLSFDSMRNYVRSLDRRDVVVSIYDTAGKNLSLLGMAAQQNLRKRIAAMMYFDTLFSADSALQNYTHATHYSYDISGNVRMLVQDMPELEEINQRYKQIHYDYDLISGNVNLLSYNRGHPDQYYQRYSYDADNRLKDVETSSDGFVWRRDASYQYYQHGPLARIDLGDLRVQGIDYAYTVQGWLKSVNGDTLDASLDMGEDGTLSGPINATDAVAFTIDYFNGDYKPIGNREIQHVPANVLNLYNGNVARQTIAMDSFQRLNKRYVYDQLNRIKKADYFDIDPATNTLTGLNDYQSRYSYDMDGNLKTLVRYGNNTGSGASIMDSLTYEYLPGTHVNDKLTNILDSAVNAYTNDVGNYTTAGAFRYLYDPIGNVKADFLSGQDLIDWNLYNKVKRTINNADSSELKFTYDALGNRISKSYTKTTATGKTKATDIYVPDANGKILAIYNHNEVLNSSDSVDTRTFSLLEHDLYGVSRLGVKKYYPQQIGGSWDYATPTFDTSRLIARHPWYSLELDDHIIWSVTQPYGHVSADSQYAQHITGQKQYELTDNLSNVLSTVSDQRTGGTFTSTSSVTDILTYRPFVQSKYDYYPFGQLMPGRYYTDTSSKCLTSTITAVIPVYDTIIHAHYEYDTTDSVRRFYFNSSCAPCGLLPRLDSVVYSPTNVTIYDTHSAAYIGTPTFILTGLNPCNMDTIRTYISNISFVGFPPPGPINFGSQYDSGWSGVTSAIGAGFTLGPPAPYPFVDWYYFGDTVSPFTWSYSPWSGGSLYSYTISYQIDSIIVTQNPYCSRYIPDSIVTHMIPTSVVTNVCNNDQYLYGHNGQMKVNEIAGLANHYTAKYWEMDPRIARRWNQDPKPVPSISNYAIFGNNSLWYSDILGDKVRNGDKLSEEEAEKKAKETIEAMEKQMKAYEISEGMKKADYLKNGGSRSAWNRHIELKNKISRYQEAAKYFAAQSVKTEKIIAQWQESSPNLYKAVDEAISSVNGKNVDFVLFASEGEGEIMGRNRLKYDGNDLYPVLLCDNNLLYIENALAIDIIESVTPNAPQTSRHGPQYLLNHEAGHFMYIVENTKSYLDLVLWQQANKINSDGGHHKSDESGKRAVEYGKTKDISK